MDGLEIGERAAEPALVDIHLAASLSGFLHCFLCLLFAADEEHFAIFRGDASEKFTRDLELADGFAEVDDVNLIFLLKDKWFHLWVPAFGLVTKVDTRFEKFLHQFCGHIWLLLGRLLFPEKGRETCRTRFLLASVSFGNL